MIDNGRIVLSYEILTTIFISPEGSTTEGTERKGAQAWVI